MPQMSQILRECATKNNSDENFRLHSFDDFAIILLMTDKNFGLICSFVW